ncbi:MAG: Imidazole glycerol phosphate synthase amidotransferase subunit [uncultured Sphingomonadaceae bacterium]|uniref:Imidazole glycerol phosphate synthase subunit HisH n=1 Tax=uncultured Sphingomonadaceae bacterium TaxID=169976 RepID=A0A6J4SNT8_9SPHN|nr:MAG: Imidazole glycerol phosphate synthase amidotransferase subunit [uncultured Sphingomonadaceae bacterium]
MSGLALIDYGAGNLRSVHNALAAVGAESVAVTDDPDAVRAADRIILPGVGAFGAAMVQLRAIPGMVEALDETVRAGGRPFLGVCVGMQLMAEWGEEHGTHRGLGWLRGTVAPIRPADRRARVPHMGWNDVAPAAPHPLFEPGEAYFLHGYAFTPEPDAEGCVLAATDHGGPVVAAVGVGSAVGVQFHPEKSQGYGLSFLRRFLDWRP